MKALPDNVRNLYPFNSHFIEVDGGRMHYLDEGEGPPVLMVHGNPTWSFFYRNVVASLKDTHRCIVPDHIGCGLSDKPQDFAYRLQDHIRNLNSLVTALNLDSFHLIVHDWGGAIGIAVAEHFYAKVEKIQILNTAAFRSTRMPLRINLCRIPFVGEMWIRGFNGFAGPATRMAVANPLPADVRRGYTFPYDNWANRIATHRFVMDIPMTAKHPSYATLHAIEQDLHQLQDKPMQIIWGGKDFCFNDHFFAEWKKRFPKANAHYFEDAGHYVLEDRQADCMELIQRFLA